MPKKTKRSVDYHDELILALKDHDEAVAYLNAALDETLFKGIHERLLSGKDEG